MRLRNWRTSVVVIAIALLGLLIAGCGGGDETSEEKAAHERFCRDLVGSVEQVSGGMSETEYLQMMKDCMEGRNGADGAWEVQKQNYIVT